MCIYIYIYIHIDTYTINGVHNEWNMLDAQTHRPTETLLAGSLTFSERMRFAGLQVL